MDPNDAENVLFIISGAHGVEGFAGSGCQVGFFIDELYEAFPSNTLCVLIHALNPYGFAWLRRVNESNVDINRNFQDFTQALPSAEAYEEIHDLLIPADWDGEIRRKADLALHSLIQERGLPKFQAAVTGGQYSRPTGLFYGGTREEWSNRTLRSILKNHIPKISKRIAIIDIHTGLGPSGYGEIMFIGKTVRGFERSKQWFGAEVKHFNRGESVSAILTGTTAEVYNNISSSVEVVPIALEFGTKPIMDVLTALRADHWLHAIPNRKTPLHDSIKRQILEGFYVDTKSWKAAIYGRTVDIILRAGRGFEM